MARQVSTIALALAALLGGSGSLAAQNRAVLVQPTPGAPGPAEVYFVLTTEAGTTTERFKLERGIWSRSVPAVQPRVWTLRLRYNGRLTPNPVDLRLRIGAGPAITLPIPRPRLREDCHYTDVEQLRRAAPLEPRDAIGSILQIDHLIMNNEAPCAQTERDKLKTLRVARLNWLRQHAPYFDHM